MTQEEIKQALTNEVEALVDNNPELFQPQPYDCTCKECDTTLEVTCEYDSDDDMRLTVEPCPKCLEESWNVQS